MRRPTSHALLVSSASLLSIVASCTHDNPAPVVTPSSPAATGAPIAKGPAQPTPTPVKIELFAMSKEPYAKQLEGELKGVVATLGPDIDFQMFYVGETLPDGSFQSLHGPKEVAGDLYQVCARDRTPKWFDVIVCQSKDLDAVDTNWEHCAVAAGVDPQAITTVAACAHGDEGKKLLTASFATSRDRSIKASPTFFIAGTEFQGARAERAIEAAICKGYDANAPAACSNIPPAPLVNVTFLSDARCDDCDTSRLSETIKRRIESPAITSLDVADPKGRALYDLFKPVDLPMIVFDASLDADRVARDSFGNALKAKGDFRMLTVGDWNPSCADANGCALTECKDTLVCRPEVKDQLELFMMGRCPFAAKGVIALTEVVGNFKKHNAKLALSVNFIGDVASDGKLTSMRGNDEVSDDLVDVCAIQHYAAGLKYLDYLACRSDGLRDKKDWDACVGGTTGFSKDVLEKCSQGAEGKTLLTKSFETSKRVKIQASPTWVVNGKFKFAAIDAETIKTKICEHQPLAGCDVTLSGPPAPARKP